MWWESRFAFTLYAFGQGEHHTSANLYKVGLAPPQAPMAGTARGTCCWALSLVGTYLHSAGVLGSLYSWVSAGKWPPEVSRPPYGYRGCATSTFGERVLIDLVSTWHMVACTILVVPECIFYAQPSVLCAACGPKSSSTPPRRSVSCAAGRHVLVGCGRPFALITPRTYRRHVWRHNFSRISVLGASVQ